MSSPNASPCFPKGKTAQGTRTGKGLGVGVGNRTDKCQAHVSAEIGCSCGEQGLAVGGLHLTRILRAFLVERLWQRRGVSSHHLGVGHQGSWNACLVESGRVSPETQVFPGVDQDNFATTRQAASSRANSVRRKGPILSPCLGAC